MLQPVYMQRLFVLLVSNNYSCIINSQKFIQPAVFACFLLFSSLSFSKCNCIRHELLIRVVRRHVKETRICLYIERWLKTLFVLTDGRRIERKSRTLQGVISPVLANIFLHYVFDMWMKKSFPQAPFERYADDGVMHYSTKEEALYLKEKLAKRFEKRN